MLVLPPMRRFGRAFLGVSFHGNIAVKAVPIRLSALTTTMHENYVI